MTEIFCFPFGTSILFWPTRPKISLSYTQKLMLHIQYKENRETLQVFLKEKFREFRKCESVGIPKLFTD